MARFSVIAVFAGVSLVASGVAFAQRGGGDWTTIGYDTQRSSWVRSDAKISSETMRKPGFQLVWKVKLNNEARQLNSLTPAALLDFYIGYRGFRSLGFVGGSSDTLIAIDTDLARIEWEKKFSSGSRSAATIPCPGGMTSSVTRPSTTAYPSAVATRGFGRGGPAKSGVGEPFEGAVTLKDPPVRFGPPPPAPAAPGRRTAAPANPFARTVQYVHAVTSDGHFHSLYVSNGDEPNPPVPFLPANAHAQGLSVFDNVAYVVTVNGCGGVANGVWALDLASKRVTQWKSGADNVAGSAGPAAGPDGTLYVAAGNRLVALEPGTLKQKASYKAGQVFTSSPVVFEFKGKDLIAAATSDGQIHLLDAATLGGETPLFKTPAYSGADFAAGALASWQDAGGTRWVLAPASGAIAAWKIVERNNVPVLEPGWVSREMISPLPPAIVNGVVFAVSSGEFRTNDARMSAAERARRSSRAVLYALDAATGKELWNSGDVIASFVHSGGLSAGGGRVYVGGHDGTQYAFSFPMEH
ncbi:MAG: hypothetical protein HY235_03440 [Acidobacteria bacterium]|nr:hypothetical protein [Acidobacteriota bacterium]